MRKAFLFPLIIIGTTVLMAVASKASAATYYVAGDVGDDSYSTAQAQNTSTPWKTIQKAADNAAAGDIVQVKGGVTYSDTGSSTCGWLGNTSVVACIDTNNGASGNPITFTNWSGTGVPIVSVGSNTSGIYVDGVDYITVSNFRIDTGATGTDGLVTDFSDHTIFKNNIIETGTASMTFGIKAFPNVSNANIYNNTIYTNYEEGSWQVGIHVGSGASSITLKNNIIDGMAGSTGIGINADNAAVGANVTSDNNLLWDNTTDFGNITPGANEVYSDSLFSDVSNDDVTLQITSPAINAGADLSGTVDYDILGYDRPKGGTYDIGAYEDRGYFVAGDTGDDTTGTGTSGNPWKTIQKAADNVIAGDTVYVKGAVTYSDTGSSTCGWLNNTSVVACIDTNNGTSGSPITYTSWPGTGVPIISVGSNADGIYVDNIDYITVSNFRVDLGSTGADGLVADNADNTIFKNNIIETGTAGMTIGIKAFPNVSNASIYNNTIYTNYEEGSWQVGIHVGNGASSITVKNNIIDGMAGSTGVGINADNVTIGANVTSDNNLLWDNTTNFGNITPGANEVYSDPLFANVTSDNLTLSPTSPAIDEGETLSEVTEDFARIARPQGSVYDIGAYERYDQTVVVNSITPNPTNDTTPTVTGTATTITGETIVSMEYRIGSSGSWTTTGISASDGAFDEQVESFTITIPSGSALSEGTNTIYVRIKEDSIGTRSGADGESVTIDLTASSPVITDLGLISNVPDSEDLYYYFTSETPIIKGTCEAGGTVYFEYDSNTYSTTCSGSGTFEITINDPSLPRDLAQLTYYGVDELGNTSSNRILTLVIGIENFPEWLLTELGISIGEAAEEEDTEDETEEELEPESELQDEIKEDMEDRYGLGDTEVSEEDEEDTADTIMTFLTYCIPLLVVFIVIVGGLTYFTREKGEKGSVPSTVRMNSANNYSAADSSSGPENSD